MNGNTPAYPTQYLNERSGNVETSSGLTKREVMAKDAPPVPDWFTIRTQLVRPKEPTEHKKLRGKDLLAYEAWRRDPCYDLDAHLREHQVEWEKYRQDWADYSIALKSERYFAWRTYFADQLLQQIEQ